jgi:alginate O-acetyltransferase complex protein AlgI
MVLSSSAYFIFLVGVFFLYWPVARFRALALAVILFANYFFYAKWDLFYLFLIPAASTGDFLIALGLQRGKAKWLRRMLVSLSLLLNLGILASFKYMPFFLENYSRLSGRAAPEWHWIFPLGISFYAFQSLTYTIDVYRRDAKATTSYLAYLASVSFFPTTLAGPITRVATLIPQFEKKDKALSSADGGKALFLIALGLTKKLLIADYLADNLVNRVFDLPKLYTGAETLIAVYAYALQLYYDFSGYTDIAIGSLLGGLWHGASWNFVVWGLLHGVGLAATRAWQGIAGGAKVEGGWRKIVRIFFTVNYVCFAWIFFRCPTLDGAISVLSRIGSLTVSFENISAPVAMVLAIAVVAHYFPLKWQGWVVDRFAATPFYAQAVALMLLAVALQYVAASGVAPFIYTKF